MNEGHAASQLILQLHDKLVQLDDLQDTPKSVIMEKLAVSFQNIIPRTCLCNVMFVGKQLISDNLSL